MPGSKPKNKRLKTLYSTLDARMEASLAQFNNLMEDLEAPDPIVVKQGQAPPRPSVPAPLLEQKGQ